LGIFDRLFKKKPPLPPPGKPEPKPEPPKRKEIPLEDTRPIKLPSEDDFNKRKPSERERVAIVDPEFPEFLEEDDDELLKGLEEPKHNATMEDEEIDEAIDSSFEALFGEPGDEVASEPLSEDFLISDSERQRDREETRTLFGQIAVNYIRPVKQFMFELQRGTASVDWISICLPAVSGMLASMTKMELREEAEVLEIYKTYLEELQRRDIRIIDGEYKKVALDLYSHLEEILPETFVIGDEGVQREGIIILSLLKQIPDVGKVTLDKMFAAGLSSLEMLFLATPNDLARTTGMPLRIAEKICEKLTSHKEEMANRPVEEDQSAILDMLDELVGELKMYHEYYEELVSTGWNDPDFNQKKKNYRKARQEASLKINVLLAELGEVDMVEQMEKLPFDRRIDDLREFLSSARKEKNH
jgi:hypothetical protein